MRKHQYFYTYSIYSVKLQQPLHAADSNTQIKTIDRILIRLLTGHFPTEGDCADALPIGP